MFLIFRSLAMICLSMDFFILFLIQLASWSCRFMSFAKFGEILAIFLQNTFSTLPIFFLSWNFNDMEVIGAFSVPFFFFLVYHSHIGFFFFLALFSNSQILFFSAFSILIWAHPLSFFFNLFIVFFIIIFISLLSFSIFVLSVFVIAY